MMGAPRPATPAFALMAAASTALFDHPGLAQALVVGGALAQTIDRARAYAKAAREALSACADSEIKAALAEIADFVVERAY